MLHIFLSLICDLVAQSLQMWLKSDRGEIEVYLCPEDDSGSASPRSASSMDEGKGESGSTFDSKSALEAATRSPNKQNNKQSSQRYTRSASRCVTVTSPVLPPEETEAMKYAFISEDDDLGTIGSTKSYLMMSEGETAEKETKSNNHKITTNTVHHTIYLSSSSSSPSTQQAQQVLASHPLILSGAGANSSPTGSLPFLSLEPPLSEEDYNFALEASEGITDLFDEDLLLTSS